MDVITFTCQYCGERQEWHTQESASAADSWHLFDAHPLRWLAIAGHRPPTDPRPKKARHRSEPPPVDRRTSPRPILFGAPARA